MAETTPGTSKNTRDRILDAAAEIMRRDGLVHATTKQIARAAQCSEALLYKYFPDKREIFLHVLSERSARLELGPEIVGVATVRENLENVTSKLIDFYAANLPMAASIFGSTDLLEEHRNRMNERGAGPHMPSAAIAGYLNAEAKLGRIDLNATEIGAVAHLLTGGALHEAFLAKYSGIEIEDIDETACRLVNACNLSPPRVS